MAVRDDLPATAIDMESDNRNDVVGGPEIAESAISNLGRGWDSDTSSDNEIQVSTVIKGGGGSRQWERN